MLDSRKCNDKNARVVEGFSLPSVLPSSSSLSLSLSLIASVLPLLLLKSNLLRNFARFLVRDTFVTR